MKVIRQYVGSGKQEDTAETMLTGASFYALKRDTKVKDWNIFVEGTEQEGDSGTSTVSNEGESSNEQKEEESTTALNYLLNSFSFIDPCIKFATDGAENGGAAKSYYLGFNVKLEENPIHFKVKLQGTKGTITYERVLKDVHITEVAEQEEGKVKFTRIEFLFTIHDNFINWNRIVFEKVRTSEDFLSKITEVDDTNTINGWEITDASGEVIEEDNKTFVRGSWTPILKENLVFDRLIVLVGSTGDNYIEHIAIQGDPGMLFVLDGEEFKIGKSGIFEIDYRTLNLKKVSVYKRNDDEFFLIDYKEVINETTQGGQ